MNLLQKTTNLWQVIPATIRELHVITQLIESSPNKTHRVYVDKSMEFPEDKQRQTFLARLLIWSQTSVNSMMGKVERAVTTDLLTMKINSTIKQRILNRTLISNCWTSKPSVPSWRLKWANWTYIWRSSLTNWLSTFRKIHV